MGELGQAELSSTMLALMQLTPLPLTVPLHSDLPDATRGHQKVVEKMSKINKKHCQVATITSA